MERKTVDTSRNINQGNAHGCWEEYLLEKDRKEMLQEQTV